MIYWLAKGLQCHSVAQCLCRSSSQPSHRITQYEVVKQCKHDISFTGGCAKEVAVQKNSQLCRYLCCKRQCVCTTIHFANPLSITSLNWSKPGKPLTLVSWRLTHNVTIWNRRNLGIEICLGASNPVLGIAKLDDRCSAWLHEKKTERKISSVNTKIDMNLRANAFLCTYMQTRGTEWRERERERM